MKHLLVGGYQVCSNKSHGVKIGFAQGGHCFSFHLYRTSFKKSSKKTLKLELQYMT
jgi:hypothetical protein